MSKRRICFVAPRAYSLLAAEPSPRHVGGAEIQQIAIARELRDRGHEISFVALDYGQPDRVNLDGITVHKCRGSRGGLPGLRFIHPRMTGLWRALARADADVYYQRGAGNETGEVAIYCRWARKPFIFAAASATDCDPAMPYLKSRRERWLYRYGLRRADRVVAQTRVQLQRFNESFSVQPLLIRSCTPDPGPSDPRCGPEVMGGPPRLLWIGRFSYEKRPEMLLELARMCPRFEFEILGHIYKPNDAVQSALRDGMAPPNVKFHAPVPHGQVDAFYRRASLLVCTSAWEGYPNTFIEAWARGLPVATTVDPDGVVAEHGLGRVAASLAELKDAAVSLVQSPELWRACSAAARRFYLENHTTRAAGNAYEALLDEMAGAPRPAAAACASGP